MDSIRRLLDRFVRRVKPVEGETSAGLMARRLAACAYRGQGQAAADAPLDPVEALKQARVKLRYGLLSEADVIDLAVELVRDGGPLAADQALMELACLDTRQDGQCAIAPFALDRALQAHAPGWVLEVGGHDTIQLVLDSAVQKYLAELDHGRNLSPGEEGPTRRLSDLLNAVHGDVGRQSWLEHFFVGGASRTVIDFWDYDMDDVEALRRACNAYLVHRSGGAEACQTTQGIRRSMAERDAALGRATEDFERGRAALREGRPGAETALRSAVKAFERWLPDTRRTATAQNELALVVKAKGGLQEAADLLRKAHHYFNARHGDRDPDTAVTMHNLGATLSQMGDLQGGGTLLERSLELQLRYRYTPTVDIANNYETLGENLHARGKLKEARPMLEEALALREQGHCAGPMAVADTCAHLSEVAKEQADYATAERLARRVVTLRSEALGHFHRDTADALNQLGVVLFSQQRLHDAEQQFRQALGRFQEEAGLHDPFAINARINLAKVLLAQGNQSLFEALEVIQHAVRACENALEPGHEYTARAFSTLGEAYRLLGHYAEAVPALTRARDLCERRFGPSDLKTAHCANSLGLVFEKCGALEEAERMLRQAEQVFAEKLGAHHADSRTAKCNRAYVLFLQGHAAEAERMWLELLRGGSYGEAAYRLGQLLEGRGDTLAARVRYTEALKTFEEKYGRESWHAALAGEALGRMHLAGKDSSQAEQCIQRAWSTYAQLYGPLHEDTNRALAELVEVVGRRDVDAAIEILRSSLADIEGDSRDAHVVTAQLSVQLGGLLHRAGRLPQASSVLSGVLSGRSRAFRFDSAIAVSAALALARVQAEMRDDAAVVRTLQEALVRCDAESNADEGAAARISSIYARELMWRGRLQEAALAAHRAWTYFRPAERDAEDAAFAFAVYWRTALARKSAVRRWQPRPGAQPGAWLLRVEFQRRKVDELPYIVEWISRTPPGKVRFVGAPPGPSRFCTSSPTAVAYAEEGRTDAGIEHAQAELVVRGESDGSEDAFAVQADLVCALAEYPRLPWKRWTISYGSAGKETLDAEGSDGAELLATWKMKGATWK